MKYYTANPVLVTARVITDIKGPDGDGRMYAQLDGDTKNVTVLYPSMTARFQPVAGDYLVIQLEDGYEYVNPKSVFERKYSPVAQ